MGTVFIVHCIDTEGPLYEEFTVPFEMIKNIYGIQIEPSEENLRKLRNGEIDLKGNEIAVQSMIDKQKMATKGCWEEIETMLAEISADGFRRELPDSAGGGWVYSWFCMDHVGFTGQNPRRRDAGHHKIFDKYFKMTKEQNKGDIVQFHHHPVSLSGNYNDSGTAFWGTGNLNQILCRKIIDRQWFPTAFRPGFHTERPDSHWFLEQWIPFDYGNQSYEEEKHEQLDMSGGRFGDWRHAPAEWRPYHPSYTDYQSKGTCKRWITRCLNMYARMRQLTQEEVDKAFRMAAEGENCILAFTDHDYKDMVYEIKRVRELIAKSAEKYKDARFEYCDAVTAMRKCLNLAKEDIGLTAEIKDSRLVVTSKNNIFGAQPFLAVRDKHDNYYWDNFDFAAENMWTYTFDNNTIGLDCVDTLGIAANNSCGRCEILTFSDGKFKKTILNQ